MILVQGIVDGRHGSLAEGIVEGVIDLVHGQAETRGGIAVDHDIGLEALLLLVGVQIGEGLVLLQGGQQLWCPFINLRRVVAENRILILRVAGAAADADILHRHKKQFSARHALQFPAHARHDHGYSAGRAA